MHNQYIDIIHKLQKAKTELGEIYLNQIIRQFAMHLIGIFVPIYLITLGYSINVALVFNLIHWIIFGISSIFVGSLSSRIGLKHTIALAMPMISIHFLLLMFYANVESILFTFPIISGLSSALYWIPLNSEFVKNSHDVNEGEEVSHLIAFPRLVTLAAPTVAGLILASLGFNILFAIVVSLLMLSIVPLFLTKDYKESFNFNLDDFRLFYNKIFCFQHFLLGGLYIADGIMWPIFIFVSFKDMISVGLSSTIAGIGVSIFILVLGKISDKFNRNKIIKIGGLLYAIMWFSRLFVSNVYEVMIISFLTGLISTLITLPLFSEFSIFAKKRNIVASVACREIWLNIGRVISLLAIIIMASQLQFQFTFVLAGVLSLLFLLA